MQQTSRRVYSFGDFALDLTTGSLLHHGDEVKLRPKAFETLRYLVENPHRLVSKEELVKAVWADAFVTANSLVKCLKDVRAAIGDEAHVIIKTVPRRGYVFVADVSQAEPLASPAVYIDQVEGIQIIIEEATPNPYPVAQSSDGFSKILFSAKPKWVRFTVVILALALLAGLGGYYFWAKKDSSANRRRSAFSIENLKLTNLTSTGDVYAPVISPNGKYLAYCSGPKLRVRQMATGSTIEILPPTPPQLWGMLRYWGVFFSADSNYIYYLIADDGENVTGTLFRVPVLGGRSQKIMNHVSGGGKESPDGQRLVFIRANQILGLRYLMTSNTDGTNEQIISTIDTNSLFGSLDWSPDGANLLYAFRQHTAEGYLHYVAEIPATGGPEIRITHPRRERILSTQWLPDKSGLVMSAIDPLTHLPQLYFISYPDGEEQRITNDLNNYKDISMADDGRTLVAQITGGITHLWLTEKGNPERAVPMAFSTRGWYQGLSWTPDNELVYTSDENGMKQICKMKADGSNSQQLTTGTGHNLDPSVTPDGRFIVFFSTRSGSGQIWRMTANGDDPVQLTHSTVGVFKPQSSPDGEWVYYTADVQGQWQVWKVPINGGEAVSVEDAPVELWAISPDGAMLAYSFFDKQQKKTRLALRHLDAPAPFRYFEISPGINLQWTKDGRALTYVEPQSGNVNIWLQPIDGKSPRPLTTLSADQWIAAFAWSSDCKMLAYTRINTTFDAVLIQLK